MKISANEIKVGNVLVHEGKLLQVLKTMHTQPGKGGAYMQVEAKDIKAGGKYNIRFRTSETVEKAYLDGNKYQYLYTQGDEIYLMDPESYEQTTIKEELLGKAIGIVKGWGIHYCY